MGLLITFFTFRLDEMFEAVALAVRPELLRQVGDVAKNPATGGIIPGTEIK